MLRVGLVCDFAEEGWPSMNLIADMLGAELKRSPGNTLDVERIRPHFDGRASSFRFLQSSRFAWNFDRLWNRTIEYPILLRKRTADFDLFHILDHSYAHLALHLPAGRSVITCHDLNAFHCLLEPETERRSFWFRAMTRRILAGLQSARHVIFVSETVRMHAIHNGIVDAARSSVIHNGAIYGPGTDLYGEQEVDRLLQTKPGEILLLSVGGTIARKRIDILLRAFAGVLEEVPQVRLVRIGGPFTASQEALARELGVLDMIRQLPFIERPILSAVYRRATVLLHTSENEGFGLPVAEAMALGCPVLASDIPVLREIGGQAALYAPVGAVSDWVRTTVELLRRRRDEPVFWQHLCQRSRERGQRFDWQVHAAQVTAVYEHAMKTAL